MRISWTCPYCNSLCTLGNDDVREFDSHGYVNDEVGCYRTCVRLVVCPNPECRQHSISLTIHKADEDGSFSTDPIRSWQLLPESLARQFPDYIPGQILSDYREACLIRDRSPKASATLSRRCLQGMIRDFWDIRKNRLKDEVDALQGKVTARDWEAIDGLRSVGNIGAHMEADVDTIIEVEPDEAALLISLIETLLADWYVVRHEREQRMAAVAKLAEEKKAKRAEANKPES